MVDGFLDAGREVVDAVVDVLDRADVFVGKACLGSCGVNFFQVGGRFGERVYTCAARK